MSDDLVKRLRAVVPYQGKSATAFLCHEAAEEIERLRNFARAADARFVDHGMSSMTDRLAYLASAEQTEAKP